MASFKEVCEEMKLLLNYDENMKIDKYTTLRLKGLETGQFMANKNQAVQAKYSWDDILATMKLCRGMVDRYIKSTSFKDEQHKVNGVMVILDNNINSIVRAVQKKNRNENKIESINLDHQQENDNKADYKRKSKGVNTKLKELI